VIWQYSELTLRRFFSFIIKASKSEKLQIDLRSYAERGLGGLKPAIFMQASGERPFCFTAAAMSFDLNETEN
jgi:hypothetical protein